MPRIVILRVNGAAVRVPDDAARRLRGQHGDAVDAEEPQLRKAPRPARTGGLLVRNYTQGDASTQRDIELLQDSHREDHRSQAALHVRSAAPIQPPELQLRFELLAALGRHDIVVAVEVDNGRARPVPSQDGVLDAVRRDSGAVERFGDRGAARSVGVARRVLGRDCHKGAREVFDLASVRRSPREDDLSPCVRWSRHRIAFQVRRHTLPMGF